LTNAIEDALAPFGVKITEQHLPPARIVELLEAAGQGPARVGRRGTTVPGRADGQPDR
jgi:carbon-monoxide dehydrogenase large subunit